MKNPLLLILSGFLFMALLTELILRVLPVSTGYNFGSVDPDQPILRGQPGFRYTYSKDWSFHLANSGALNNYGFRSSYDYAPAPHALVVIGNSFVQADALPPRETLAERMGALLQRPVYAIGVDGFSLADYLAAAKWAGAIFHPDTLVVLLTTGDLNHSCTQRLGEHYLASGKGVMTLALIDRPAPSRFKRMVNDSRLFRYLYDNLHAAANWTKGWRRNDDSSPNPDASAASLGCTDKLYQDAATEFLLSSFHEIERSGSVRVVFALAPGYRREQQVAPGGTRDVDTFARRAARADFEIVRMDAAFSSALHSGTQLDFLPIDGHWNGPANAIAAGVIAAAISSHPASTRTDQAH
jgi:hypothetical protein